MSLTKLGVPAHTKHCETFGVRAYAKWEIIYLTKLGVHAYTKPCETFGVRAYVK